MYIISGTLYFLFFFFLVLGNELLRTFNYSYNNSITILFMIVSMVMGIFFYYLHFSEKRKK